MLNANRVALTSKDVAFHLLRQQNQSQMLYSISYSVTCNRIEAENLQNTNYRRQFLRSIHVTEVNKDIELGLKALGCGIAATGVIGSGIGVGIIFGNCLTAIGRNPSTSKLVMGPATLGVAFCESLGLLAIIVAFLLLP